MNNSVIIALILLYLSIYLKRRSRKRLPLPPGPPADPLIGHLRLMPPENHELTFHGWSKKYGDVIHLRVLGRDIIVLNSVQAATDLFDKRGGLYSDRPDFVIYLAMGWDPDLAFLPYGPRFRKHRKLLQSYFTQPAGVKFQPIQQRNARILARGFVENKRTYSQLIGRFTTAIVMSVAYGQHIDSDDDEYLQMAQESGYSITNGGPPGGTMVDFFPILRHFPSWFPGTFYYNFARERRWSIDDLYDRPYEHVKEQAAQGNAQPSFLLKQLEAAAGKTLTDEEIGDIKGSAAVIFGAGAETTWTSLETFLLAILHHPEVQKKGQEEIDRVVGSDRLPTFDDYDALPYVGYVTQEILRWHPTVPIGLPHRSTEDDIYRGMFIPKGSVVFANALGMALDENMYAEPTKFNPDRFLPKSEGGNEEPYLGAAFGFGRRICPGRHLATASIWIAVAMLFATVDITREKDENGDESLPEIHFQTGLTSRPKQFPCTITPRSTKMVHTVKSECDSWSG